MSTAAHRFLGILLATSLAGCAQPGIDSVGGPGNGGTNGGGSGGGGRNGGNKTDGPDFSVSFPDGGASDVPRILDPGDDKSCAGELHQGKLVPVDLLLLIDISGSMEESAGTQSKWTALHDALVTFVKDPKSAGLGVGLETFPPPSKVCKADGDCGGGFCEEKGVCGAPAAVATTEPACNDITECTNLAACTKYGVCSKSGLRCVGAACGAGETCNPRPKFCVVANAGCAANLYENPIVAIAELPGAVPGLEGGMANIVPQGTTPTTPAVTGALTHLRTRAMAHPDRKQVLVLATDGMPTECGFTNTIATATTAIRQAQMGMPGIPTYVVGIFGGNQIARARPALEGMATAGGTGMPFVLMTGNDLNVRFLEAINQIRGATLGCEFTIPKPNVGMNLDFDRLNVRVNWPGGPEDLIYVGTMDKCDPMRGGWYYDADPKLVDPTRVLLCPASCTKLKMTAGVSVDLRVGCRTIIK